MRHPRFSRDDSGTSSLEVVLVLPFVALLLVVALNLSGTPIKKMQAHMASRFAGTTYTRLLTVEDMRPIATGETNKAFAAAYPGVQLGIGSSGTIFSSPVGALGGRTVTTARTKPPRTVGRWTYARPATSRFVIEGVTWTYDDIPISLEDAPYALQQLTNALASAVGVGGLSPMISGMFFAIRGVFWIFGGPFLWLLGS